jgi:hypothetical protein
LRIKEVTVAGTSVERSQDMAPSSSEIEVPSHSPRPVYNPDAPSEQWGWHGTWREFAPRGRTIILGLFALGCFALLFGNHVSNVENWYLIGIGTFLLIWIASGQLRTIRDRRRKR